jgi:alpha 1,3-glucosidase
MHAHRADGTVAIFSLTGSENWIDITKTSTDTQTHWMAESGVLDLVIFLGPTNEEIFEQYALLTGTTALPQMFAIGHHQCRWNYLSQEDVLQVSENFDKYDMPMDVVWLDIEYAKDVGSFAYKLSAVGLMRYLTAHVFHVEQGHFWRPRNDARRASS